MSASKNITARVVERLAAGPITETTAQLAADLGVHPRKVQQAFAALRRAGLVHVELREHDGVSRVSSRVITLTGVTR